MAMFSCEVVNFIFFSKTSEGVLMRVSNAGADLESYNVKG